MEPLVLVMVGAAVGWILGVSRDRRTAVRGQQIAAITQLHERSLEVARKELRDGKSVTLAVGVQGGTKKRSTPLDGEEVDYQAQLGQWREKLREDEDRARLWIDTHTVDLVGAYFLLMMQCSSWEEFGHGNLTEDRDFARRLRLIFGRRTKRILNAIIRTKGDGEEPWLLDCIELSHSCLSVIQRRIHCEVAHPVRFGLEKCLDAANRKWRSHNGS